MRAKEGQEVALEVDVLVTPELVGNLKRDALVPVASVQRVEQAAERSVRFGELGRVDTEHLRHFHLRLAAGTCRCHGHRNRSAQGRADKVLLRRFDFRVEVEPELIARTHRIRRGRGIVRGRAT